MKRKDLIVLKKLTGMTLAIPIHLLTSEIDPSFELKFSPI